MLLCISGVQCSGKSSLMQMLKDDPEIAKHYIFVNSASRYVAEQTGRKLSRDSSLYDQVLISTKQMTDYHYHASLKHKNVVFDRHLLDTFVYASWLHEYKDLPTDALSMIFHMRKICKMDKTIMCGKVTMEGNGVRDTDLEYRDIIDEIFSYVAEDYTRLLGSKEERRDKIKKILVENIN